MSARSIALVVVLVAAVLLMAACGGEDATATPTATSTSAAQPSPSPSPGVSPTADVSPTGMPLEGDPVAGEALFTSASPAPCSSCHSTGSNTIVGPGLAGVGERAATGVQGLSADEYLEQSIREPDAFTVPGFTEGLMPAFDDLTDEQMQDLIAYLKTLQ